MATIEAAMWSARKRLDDVAITAAAHIDDLKASFEKDTAAIMERQHSLELGLGGLLLRLRTMPAAAAAAGPTPGAVADATAAASTTSAAGTEIDLYIPSDASGSQHGEISNLTLIARSMWFGDTCSLRGTASS
eukprot:NODE_5439_length_582_cov_169.165085.p1 GENE.NODE_5439_length_582_cov_169.165085~~NODE_5439_length_582_cov_169.165085.p1  ORF type:complete len:141 (-),score=23.28 NODE_5439_length_582_cov_169.165085:142-540(-)